MARQKPHHRLRPLTVSALLSNASHLFCAAAPDLLAAQDSIACRCEPSGREAKGKARPRRSRPAVVAGPVVHPPSCRCVGGHRRRSCPVVTIRPVHPPGKPKHPSHPNHPTSNPPPHPGGHGRSPQRPRESPAPQGGSLRASLGAERARARQGLSQRDPWPERQRPGTWAKPDAAEATQVSRASPTYCLLLSYCLVPCSAHW